MFNFSIFQFLLVKKIHFQLFSLKYDKLLRKEGENLNYLKKRLSFLINKISYRFYKKENNLKDGFIAKSKLF